MYWYLVTGTSLLLLVNSRAKLPTFDLRTKTDAASSLAIYSRPELPCAFDNKTQVTAVLDGSHGEHVRIQVHDEVYRHADHRQSLIARDHPNLSLSGCSKSSTRSESDHAHGLPDRIGILTRVAIDSAQNRFHSRSQQALGRDNVLRSDDVLVQPDPETDSG